jgi:uncharacterized protein (TIGR02679 family)
VSVPPSLRSPELDRLWARVRERLEAREGSRGRLPLPELSPASYLALKSLLARPPRKSLDLAALEAALARLGVGPDLASALAALGQPVSSSQAERRAGRAARRQARQAARELAALWPEPWAGHWIGEVIRAGVFRGQDLAGVTGLLQRIRRVLDHLDTHASTPISRVDLAAQVLGSSHALDSGTREEAAVARALGYKLGSADHRDLWAQAGVHLDLTSAPVLTWRLPLSGALAQVTQAALDAGIPVHLSRFALERHPANVPAGSRILVVENPRIVEAAAQRRAETCVVSTNGNPGSAVLLLLGQLRDAQATLHYHGDFDTAGLAICERMMRFGLTPWRMDAADYQAALAAADAEEATLPRERRAPGPTPWDPALQPLFDRERRIVHEERLLPGLIG